MKVQVYFFIFSLLLGHAIAEFFNTSYLDKEDSCIYKKTFKENLYEKYLRLRRIFKKPIPRNHTKFFLYTIENSNRSQELILNNRTSIEYSNFDPKKPVRILIHGYMNTFRSCFNVLIRNAYLEKGDYNVIVVDWSVMASRFIYFKIKKYLEKVADLINEFTKFLHDEYEVSYDNIYLIGHSLGAHIAGLAGRRLYNSTNVKYDTIFALDPAGPTFPKSKSHEEQQKKLEENQNLKVILLNDANYIETIHTDMKKFGIKGQIGNASFYPDYGRSQKICPSTTSMIIRRKFACDHDASYIYFADSIINSNKYLGQPCDKFDNILKRKCLCTKRDDCDFKYRMGGEPSQKKNGIFYLDIEKDED